MTTEMSPTLEEKTFSRTTNSETEGCYPSGRPVDGGELRRRDGHEDRERKKDRERERERGGEFGEEPGTAHDGWAEQ